MPAILPLLWSFATSQIGIVLLLLGMAFGYGHHRAEVACKEREAVERARAIQAHADEMARQARVADAIALVDRTRASEASRAADAMQAEIEQLKSQLAKKGQGHEKAKDCGCVIDADFARRVQRLDRAGRH
jgi:hypothetical protein